jgi:hypothetical protein
MVGRARAIPLFAAVVSVAVTGCSVSVTAGSVKPRATPTRHLSSIAARVFGPITGVRLSALVPTPQGFTLDRAASSDSGTRQATPIPGASSTSGISCASWFEGTSYWGPGTVAYTIRNYTGPDQVSLDVGVNIYPAGTGARAYAQSAALERRCLHFSYQDKDGLRYTVDAKLGPSARVGDQSQEFDAIDTAPDGARFTTEVTFIQVGDAMVSATETGATSAPVSRDNIALAAIVDALRAAGY